MSEAWQPNNCAINERTGDGALCGRCWFGLKQDPKGRWLCPRHGDVTDAREHFIQTKHLTPETKKPR